MAGPSPEPDELEARVRSGDERALAELFTLYRDRLKRAVSFRLDPRLYGRVDASDVLQESYLDAAQRLPHYLKDPSKSFFIWLRLVVGQRMIDLHRHHLGAQKRDAGQEVSLNAAGPTEATSVCLAAQLTGHLTSPSQAAIRAETRARLEAALDLMDPLDREVIALRHFEELSNGEVAEMLGLKKQSASSRYVRALRRLKEILAEMPDFGEGSQLK